MATKITPTVFSLDTVHITDLELAINHFRALQMAEHTQPLASNPYTLNANLSALAEVYGLMTHFHHQTIYFDAMSTTAQSAWLAWYQTTADTPCIAICSTAQGDSLCKGCGRTEDEVQNWPSMSPCAKRHVWHRINTESISWRFNKYADRVHASSRLISPPEHILQPEFPTHQITALSIPFAPVVFEHTSIESSTIENPSMTGTPNPAAHVSKRLSWTHKRTIYECSSRSRDAFCLTF